MIREKKELTFMSKPPSKAKEASVLKKGLGSLQAKEMPGEAGLLY